MQLSAYIPCCNNALHIRAAVESLQRQSMPIDDLMVIDDGSTDDSAAIAAGLGVRVIRHDRTLGRGAVNAQGIADAKHDLVVILGATNVVPPDFAERAVRWFSDERVAAVCGRIVPPPPQTLTDRWRARHLFLVNHRPELSRHHHFASTGSMLRRSAALQVGNFDRSLTHTEDGELGVRLAASGYDVLFDPDLHVIPRWHDSLWKMLERHWRWYAGTGEAISWVGYSKAIWYSMKVMVPADLREGDWGSAAVSVVCPHHHFWLTVWRRLTTKRQPPQVAGNLPEKARY